MNIGAVAQWIRRLTSDQETVGSSPTGVIYIIVTLLRRSSLATLPSRRTTMSLCTHTILEDIKYFDTTLYGVGQINPNMSGPSQVALACPTAI